MWEPSDWLNPGLVSIERSRFKFLNPEAYEARQVQLQPTGKLKRSLEDGEEEEISAAKKTRTSLEFK